MKIMTEKEYRRRIEEAKMQGYKERCAEVEKAAFEDNFWKAIRETRQDLDRQILMLRDVIVKAGMEDPFAPPKVSSQCVCASPGDIGY